MEWFTVDKEGLAKLLDRKGKAFVLFELLQNSWDTDAAYVNVQLEPIANKPYCDITVSDDDPHGFVDLAHSFTLFAESSKKSDPEKRGRFNLGEKLVLALCDDASIASTTGTIYFDKTGRHNSREKTTRGSIFQGRIRMTRAEYEDVLRVVRTVIPPHDKETRINGGSIPDHKLVEGFRVTLATEIGDGEGFLRRSSRETLVSLHEVAEGENATLYEMGIPVVELSGGEPWHINVHQKIPLNADRDNVTPAYMRDLRTAVLNHMHRFIKGADAASKAWVRDAAADPDAKPETVKHITTERFGEKTVIYDPSDPEGTKKAMAQGYTVIPGGALSKDEWDNIRRDSIVLPAGQVTPSRPSGFADTTYYKEDELPPGMRNMRACVQQLGKLLLDCDVKVSFCSAPTASTAAAWSDRSVVFNVGVLGKKWFARGMNVEQLDLVLHEFGHHFESDHLSKRYNDALTRLGARLAFLVAKDPTLVTGITWEDKV
jgi:hypothetical protein